MRNIVLFSGGLDSLAALVWARKHYGKENVLALYCNVGHRYAEKEIAAVEEICQRLNQEYVIDDRLDLSNFEKPKEQNSIIPYRNTFFILIAASYLPEEGGNIILQNVVQGESSTIDRRPIFNKKLQEFLPFADHRKVNIYTPHRGWTKGEICKLLKASHNSELMMKTVGCYSDTFGNCGKCNSCFRSWIALEYAEVPNAKSRFENDPSKWAEGITIYIQNMLNGQYDPKRVNETFTVLRKNGIEIPTRTYVFDLDGVIAIKPLIQNSYENGTLKIDIDHLRECYRNAEPNPIAVEKLKKIASRGDKITICTARHESDREITEKWLKDHCIPYNNLVMGKPYGHFYIDDRAISLEDV